MKMKHIFVLMLTLVTLVMVLSACQKDDAPSSTPISSSQIPVAMVTLPAVEPPTVSTPQYDLSAENGKAYLNLKNPLDLSDPNGTMVAAPAVIFNTVSEMRERLLSGNFSEEELYEINRFTKDPITGKTEICNVNQLFELKLNNGISKVSLSGQYYRFDVLLNKQFDCMIEFMDTDQVTKVFESFDDYLERQTRWTVLERSTIAERNAEQVLAKNSTGIFKVLTYSIETEQGVYRIYEYYFLTANSDIVIPSETVPSRFKIYYYDNNGVLAELTFILGDPTAFSRPSIETLTSFWFEPLATNTSGNDHVTE